jgi:hypothetical protein
MKAEKIIAIIVFILGLVMLFYDITRAISGFLIGFSLAVIFN